MKVGRFVVRSDHPCLAGHFPGSPVVPGVLLLDEVLALLQPHLPGTITGVSSAKFLHAVAPGEAVEVTLDPATGAFTCEGAGRTVARGRASLAEL